MFRQFKEKTQTVKLTSRLADPFASEHEWLNEIEVKEPLQTVVNALSTSTPAEKCSSLSMLKSSAMAAMVAASATILVHNSFDFGYRIIAHFLGQPSPENFNQGITAAFALGNIVFPLCLGLILAATRLRKGDSKWLICLLSWSAAISCLWNIQIHLLNGPSIAVGIAIACGLATASYFGACKIFQRFHLENLIKAMPVRYVSFIYAVCAAIYFGINVVDQFSSIVFFGEFFDYVGCILLLTKPRLSLVSPVKVSLLALSPIVLCNLFNIVATCSSLALDVFNFGVQLGWRACASALLITLVGGFGFLAGVKLKSANQVA